MKQYDLLEGEPKAVREKKDDQDKVLQLLEEIAGMKR
jgi:hypothetical protein